MSSGKSVFLFTRLLVENEKTAWYDDQGSCQNIQCWKIVPDQPAQKTCPDNAGVTKGRNDGDRSHDIGAGDEMLSKPPNDADAGQKRKALDVRRFPKKRERNEGVEHRDDAEIKNRRSRVLGLAQLAQQQADDRHQKRRCNGGDHPQAEKISAGVTDDENADKTDNDSSPSVQTNPFAKNDARQSCDEQGGGKGDCGIISKRQHAERDENQRHRRSSQGASPEMSSKVSGSQKIPLLHADQNEQWWNDAEQISKKYDFNHGIGPCRYFGQSRHCSKKTYPDQGV